MTDEKIDDSEETEENEEVTMPKGMFWLIVLGGLVVVGIMAYFIFHHPATAAKSAVDNLPSMVGGC